MDTTLVRLFVLDPCKLRIGPGDSGVTVQYLRTVLGVGRGGRYDAATCRAVERLQASAGITVDGIVGPRTWEVVDAVAITTSAGSGTS